MQHFHIVWRDPVDGIINSLVYFPRGITALTIIRTVAKVLQDDINAPYERFRNAFCEMDHDGMRILLNTEYRINPHAHVVVNTVSRGICELRDEYAVMYPFGEIARFCTVCSRLPLLDKDDFVAVEATTVDPDIEKDFPRKGYYRVTFWCKIPGIGPH